MSAKGPSDPTITREVLLSLYYGESDTSLEEVAEKLGYHREAVRRWCIHFSIPIKTRHRKGGKRVKNPQLLDRAWLAEQLKTKLQKEIAEELGAKEAAVNYWVRQHGLHNPDKSQTIKDALKKRYPKGRSAEQAANWKGGRRILNGYMAVYAPDHPNARHGAVFEHRLVAEQKIGRLLGPGDIVHHIDGDRLNNHPNNLEVKARGRHVSDHFKASHEVTQVRAENALLKEEVEQLKQRIQELEAQLDRNEGRRCNAVT